MPNLFLGFPVSRAKFADVSAQALVGNLPHTNLYWTSFFDSVDGFNYLLSLGVTFTLPAWYVKLQVVITLNSRVRISKETRHSIIAFDWAKDRTWRAKVRVVSDVDSALEVWIGTGYVFSRECLGFVFTGGFIYARAATDVSNTDVQVENNPAGGFDVEHSYKIIYTAGIKAEYYIDDVLVATITTDLPTGTDEAEILTHLELRNTSGTDTGNLYSSHTDCFQKS